MAKYHMGKYNTGSFCEGINIDISLITYEYKVVITITIQSYVLHWYNMYMIHPRMDIPKAMI